MYVQTNMMSIYVALENWTTGQKTEFWRPGHEHCASQNITM